MFKALNYIFYVVNCSSRHHYSIRGISVSVYQLQRKFRRIHIVYLCTIINLLISELQTFVIVFCQHQLTWEIVWKYRHIITYWYPASLIIGAAHEGTKWESSSIHGAHVIRACQQLVQHHLHRSSGGNGIQIDALKRRNKISNSHY